MTEIPEHLLKRSRERREALGLGGGGGGDAGSTPAAPAGGGDEPAASAPVPAQAAAAPAKAAPAAAPAAPAPPPPPPPYVEAALSRPRIPRWALPVLGVLPLWALIYAGAIAPHEEGISDPVLVQGQAVYSAQCSACHGGVGEGGTGRPLNGDNVTLTFPEPADHIAWVTNGSPAPGTPYGNPDRPGGQRVSQSDGYGAMPAFGGALTEEEIIAVVRYEREVIGNEDTATAALATGGAGADAPANEAQTEGGDVGGDEDAGEATDGSGASSDASQGSGGTNASGG